MSMLSSVTGIGINPFGKRKIKIDPLKALGTALTVGSMGGFGPVAAGLSRIPGGAALVKGATKAGAVIGAGKRLLSGGGGEPGVPQVTKNGIPISLSDINPNIPAPTGGDGGGDTGLLGSLMNYGKNHLGDIAVGGLAAMDAANAARASKRQGQLSDEMLQMAKARWNSGQQLRDMGTAGLTRPIDWNSVYADPTNPFAQQPAPAAPALPAPPRRRLLAAGAA